MNIYIIEDDLSVINILEDIIENYDLGKIIGKKEGALVDVKELLILKPEIILIDFLMPGKDGIELVKELKKAGLKSKFIMISQVSSKSIIGKAYDVGVDFFIGKPINIIEVKSVIKNVTAHIKNEQTISNLKNVLISEFSNIDTSSKKEKNENKEFTNNIGFILSRLGMSGEKGSQDIIKLCEYIKESKENYSKISIGKICKEINDSPKNMEQRIRRAIIEGMKNISHMGIEDYMNETFTTYSSVLFSFEEIRKEMDYIRGLRKDGGKVSIKKFIVALIYESERN